MSLFLVAPGIDLSIELFVAEHIEKALAVQWERLNGGRSHSGMPHTPFLAERISSKLI